MSSNPATVAMNKISDRVSRFTRRRLNGAGGWGKRACKAERRRSVGLTRKKIRDVQNESDNEHESYVEQLKPVTDRRSGGAGFILAAVPARL